MVLRVAQVKGFRFSADTAAPSQNLYQSNVEEVKKLLTETALEAYLLASRHCFGSSKGILE
jgi:hypothetical protein